ncbi:LutC/YkgG family protein [Micromonospora sp. LOL_015]|uniref:LutC/YkgG family protein n=1 Tax=Micromonospora sp. LOL_015 TaxID=3345416 RepID=UPI003A860886
MTDARTEILARLRAARDHRPAAVAVRVPRDYRTAGADPADADPAALLMDRLIDYRATVHRCFPDQLADRIAEVLTGVRRVAVPQDLPGDWLRDFSGEVLRDHPARPLTVTDLDRPGLTALTGCAVAIGRTGTVLLDTGPAQGPRRLTLVPDLHVCVVRTNQVVAGVPAALARLADPTRPITLISGPSATSDIELNRIEGVHGPRRLDVVLVDTGRHPAAG